MGGETTVADVGMTEALVTPSFASTVTTIGCEFNASRAEIATALSSDRDLCIELGVVLERWQNRSTLYHLVRHRHQLALLDCDHALPQHQ